jgi:hypothetical protein
MNLNSFNTIIFDLDFTIWDGCEEKYWAKCLSFPFTIEDRKIYGSDKKYIEFHEDIKFVLSELYKSNKNLGFITLGGLLNISDEDQPVTHCLKMYDVYKYFNHQKTILYKTDIKSKYLMKQGKTIFIDDAPINLEDMKNVHPDVVSLDRFSFKNWKELL